MKSRDMAVLLVAPVVLIAGCGADDSTAEGAAEKPAGAISDGDYGAAGAMVCQDEVDDEGSADASIVERVAAHFEGVDKLEVDEVVADDDGRAEVAFTATDEDGASGSVTMQFQLIDGQYYSCDSDYS